MPWSYKRHPVTGDRIPDGKGGWAKTRTAENLVRNQLLAKYARAWQDPDLGCLLHERERFRQAPAELTAEETRRALGRVERAGRITSLEVVTRAVKSGRVDGYTRFADTSSGDVVTTKIPSGG